MKKLLLILLITLSASVSNAQEVVTTFNQSFYGDYNPATNDYSLNMEIDTVANVALYINSEKTKIIVTSEKDTIFNHNIWKTEQGEDLLIYNTTTYIYEAVFMINENEGITMLYSWVDQTESVNMHYKHKHFWSNK